MIHSSPFFSARVRRPATSEPPAGSENSWHQIFSPEASGGRYLRFSSSPANPIMVGPHMPWPMMKTRERLPNGPSSCCQITRSIGEAPRPPYSFGQCRQAQPASAFFFCQAFATSSRFAPLITVRPSEALRRSSSYCFGALAAIQAFASARNPASCGVASKFMSQSSARFRFVGWVERSETHGLVACVVMGFASLYPSYGIAASGRVLLAHAVDQRVFPIGQRAERHCGSVGAAVVHVAVELPGESHAAVHLDVVLAAVL